MQKDMLTKSENEIGQCLINYAVKIHRELGPGLLEVVYEAILASELSRQGFRIERQVPISIEYRGMKFHEAFRADLIIEKMVIVELKCVEKINSSHKKQLLTYLRLTDMKLGFLLNFSEALMKNGIVRIVNNLAEN